MLRALLQQRVLRGGQRRDSRVGCVISGARERVLGCARVLGALLRGLQLLLQAQALPLQRQQLLLLDGSSAAACLLTDTHCHI